MKSFIILLLSVSSLMSVDFVTGDKVSAKTQREKTGTPKSKISFGTTVGHQATVVVGESTVEGLVASGSTTGDAVFSGAGEEYSIYKSYFKYDYKVVVTSPGFWVFPEKELTMVRFDVSAANGYNSSEEMIASVDQEAAQSGLSNAFKAVLTINNELDINSFNQKKEDFEDKVGNLRSESYKILSLYYYLVEQDETCYPSTYAKEIKIYDNTDSNYGQRMWYEFNYPNDIHLIQTATHTGNDLEDYQIDLSYRSPQQIFNTHFVTLKQVADAAYLLYNSESTPQTYTNIMEDLVANCQSYQEEIDNIENRELTDTDTVELVGGINVETRKYETGNLEDMVFSFTTPAPLDWENVGLSININVNTRYCRYPYSWLDIVAMNTCQHQVYPKFSNDFGREDITLISNPSSNEHKLRLFFKNSVSEDRYRDFNQAFSVFALNSQFKQGSTVTVKLHAVNSLEVQDGDDNTIFNTANGQVLHEWVFELKGDIMTPVQERISQ